MMYKILYDNIPKGNSKKNMKLIFPLLLLLIFIVISQFIPDGLVLSFLFPGAGVETVAAFEILIENLQHGSKLTDAITVFCEDIFANG